MPRRRIRSISIKKAVITFQEIKDSLTQAINSFITTDRDLLLYDSRERSIMYKLAEHSGGHFGSWNINCECDRIGKEKQQKFVGFFFQLSEYNARFAHLLTIFTILLSGLVKKTRP